MEHLRTLSLLVGLSFLATFIFFPSGTSARPEVDAGLFLKLLKGESVDVILSFKNSDVTLDGIRSQVQSKGGSSRDRREALYQGLKRHADQSQVDVLQALKKAQLQRRGIKYTQLWTVNRISVRNVDWKGFQLLGRMEDIQEIRIDREFPLYDHLVDPEKIPSESRIEWNVEYVDAPQVWEKGFRGEGIVLGSIDTGVRHTHLALRNKYVPGCWFDPYEDTPTPVDTEGHGTHTVGTMCGDLGLGLAPGAKFVSCRACKARKCTESALIRCGEFMLYPTTPKGAPLPPSCQPHIINNSWGGGPGDDFYWHVIEAWNTAGIFSVFSAGNSGPQCYTGGSPGDYNNTISVGATDARGTPPPFSSRGPSVDGRTMKPDLAAPGVKIRSAHSSADDAMVFMSGTSMAAPHLAGIGALILGAFREHRPDLTPECAKTLMYELIRKSTVAPLMGGAGDRNCGQISDLGSPNTITGAGICNAGNVIRKLIDADFSFNC